MTSCLFQLLDGFGYFPRKYRAVWVKSKEKNAMDLRLAEKKDLSFLKEMLFQAAYWRSDLNTPELEEGLSRPDLKYLLENWGRSGDLGLIAEGCRDLQLGAAWFRFWTDKKHSYGYISTEIPELAIGVAPEFRGRGIGKRLLELLLNLADLKDIPGVSLSVERDNYAVGLYVDAGFSIYKKEPGSFTMLRLKDAAAGKYAS